MSGVFGFTEKVKVKPGKSKIKAMDMGAAGTSLYKSRGCKAHLDRVILVTSGYGYTPLSTMRRMKSMSDFCLGVKGKTKLY